jgi:hypothetical protein
VLRGRFATLALPLTRLVDPARDKGLDRSSQPLDPIGFPKDARRLTQRQRVGIELLDVFAQHALDVREESRVGGIHGTTINIG